MWPFRRPFDDRCLKAAAGERSSSLRADICAPRRIVASISVFTAFRQASGTNLAKVENSKRRQEACRAPGFASHASPTLAALRFAHEHTRAQHARHARCTHASLASDAHALTQQHALTRQKHHVVPRVTGHWLTVGRPAAEPSSAQSQRKCTRHISLLVSHVHHPHAVHATHHHCVPLPYRRDMMMTMSEMKTTDTIQKTENTMDDASECVSARTCGSHAPRRIRTHGAKHSHALSKTRTLPTHPRWPWNDLPFAARHVATVGGANRAIGLPSTTRVMTCSSS